MSGLLQISRSSTVNKIVAVIPEYTLVAVSYILKMLKSFERRSLNHATLGGFVLLNEKIVASYAPESLDNS